jgi:hypothetical protein
VTETLEAEAARRVSNAMTIEQVFEWAHRIIRAQKPPKDTLHAIRNGTERSAVWEAAAKRIAAIAKDRP